MSDAISERRLAAILLGDVVGYSRLMGIDEIGTMRALKAHRNELILPALAAYRARMVDAPGDAMLIEFGSAVDAVSCAVVIQRRMILRNADVAPDRRLSFRLGINLGDVVIDGEAIYGDGVNVAARLESLCEPGGLCISRSIEEQIRGKLDFPFVDDGEQALKNIAHPVRIFRLSADYIATRPEMPLPTPRKIAPTLQAKIAPSLMLNDTYQIDTLIASGGMGEIWKGHEIHSGGTVAIKVIRADMMRNETALALFQKEARVLKDVNHDAIVRYYSFSFDPASRRHYLAMEFVDGVSLSDLMRQGPLPFEDVSALRQRVASGLEVAHERGVIHRDISPDNIIIPGRDLTRAKIIDFGIARAADIGGNTIIGDGLAGKINYMSPEQVGLAGGDVTPKSDIYSFGLVLAEASLGAPIDMKGTGSHADIIERRRKLPDLSAIDLRLRPLIAAMLAPEPGDRPRSMAEIAQWGSQSAPRRGSGTVSPLLRRIDPAPKPSRHIERWIIGATLGIALAWVAGLGVYETWFAERHDTGVDHQTHIDPPQHTSPPPIDVIKTYIKDYDGGACFFLHPMQVTDTSAAIEGFTQSKDVLTKLDAAFTGQFGFAADIVGNRLWSGQCPVLAFLRQVGTDVGIAPRLFLRSTRIGRGESLAGEVHDIGQQTIALLEVREDGTTLNVSKMLRRDGDAQTFDLPMPQGGTGGPFPQVLVVVASARPLAALAGDGTMTAERLFRAILDEAASTNNPLTAGVKVFLLGG